MRSNKICGILFIIFLGLMFSLVGCGTTKTTEGVTGEIIAKHFVESSSYTTIMSTGKTCIPVTHTTPAKYELTVKYKEYTRTIDSEQLYNSLEVGDSINMILVKEYSKDTGNLTDTYIKEAY